MKPTRKSCFIGLAVLAAVSSTPLQLVTAFPLAIAGLMTASSLLMKVSAFANNILLYSLLFLPALRPWQGARRHLPLIFISLALVASASLGVPAISQARFARVMEEKRSTYISDWKPMTVRSIALISNNPLYVRLSHFDGFIRAGCSALCQSLLYDYGLEKVVVILPPRNAKEEPRITSYRIRKQSICKDIRSTEWERPSSKSRILHGECPVAEDGANIEQVDATVVDLTLRDDRWVDLGEDLKWGTRPWHGLELSGFTKPRLIAVHHGGRRDGKPVYRAYEADGWALTTPLHIIQESRGCILCGNTFATKSDWIGNATDMESVMRKLGFNVDWTGKRD
jgi:hypothetical protein